MKIDDVKKLHQKKYRAELGHYLVEGEHLVIELQKALQQTGEAPPIRLYVTEARLAWAQHTVPMFDSTVISDRQMAQLSDTKSPQGVVACVPLPAGPATDSSGQRCIFLHEVQDPGNLGTIIRNLVWFGGFRLLLSPNSVDPFNSKVVRASMGAIFHLPIETDCALETLPQRFARFAYLDLQGAPINSPAFAQYDCYLFGNEARGVPLERLSGIQADAFTIPGNGPIDSLNLANSVGICAYQMTQA